jgi:hypothetical protein
MQQGDWQGQGFARLEHQERFGLIGVEVVQAAAIGCCSKRDRWWLLG